MHDKAAGFDKTPTGPRYTTEYEPSHAPAVNSKLMVTNLHYELTPKDLTVRPFSVSFLSQLHVDVDEGPVL